MRIIAGAARGRKLRAPRGSATRPTADRVRESVFNILGPVAAGARVLDLFAGAGGLGLEALSRGAAWAVFVDRAPAAARCVRDNLAILAMTDQAEVITSDALRAVRRMRAHGDRFDWVFVDPPYASDLAAATLTTLGESPVLADGATVIVEHDRRRPLPDASGQLARTDQRAYGDTIVSFYGTVLP